MPRSRRTPRQVRLQEILLAARTSRALTQEELAHRLRRPQTFVSKYELGERRLDVIEFLEICAALDLDAPRIVRELLKLPPG